MSDSDIKQSKYVVKKKHLLTTINKIYYYFLYFDENQKDHDVYILGNTNDNKFSFQITYDYAQVSNTEDLTSEEASDIDHNLGETYNLATACLDFLRDATYTLYDLNRVAILKDPNEIVSDFDKRMDMLSKKQPKMLRFSSIFSRISTKWKPQSLPTGVESYETISFNTLYIQKEQDVYFLKINANPDVVNDDTFISIRKLDENNGLDVFYDKLQRNLMSKVESKDRQPYIDGLKDRIKKVNEIRNCLQSMKIKHQVARGNKKTRNVYSKTRHRIQYTSSRGMTREAVVYTKNGKFYVKDSSKRSGYKLVYM